MGKCKLLANIAILVFLYGSPIWADPINPKKYQRTEIILIQQKAALRCVSASCTVPTKAVCVLAGIPQLRWLQMSNKRVYSMTHRISPRSGKMLWIGCNERQITLHKWKEWLSSLQARQESGAIC